MLTLKVAEIESYDEANNKFIKSGGVVLQLEHSLVSLSKWEEIHEKPFLGKDTKTPEEILDYFRCMVLTPDYDPEVLNHLDEENLKQIDEYINKKMTATFFNEKTMPSKHSSEQVTAELVYFWMTSFNIPLECQYWHFNKLITLIKVHNTKNQKPKKMGKAEMAQQRRELNARRREQYGTSG